MSWKTLFRLITKKLSISIQPTIVSSNRSGHGNSLSVNCNHRWKNVIISTNINSSVNVNGKGNCNRNANGKFNYNDNTNDNRNHNSNGNGNGNVNRNHNGNGRGYGNRNINENDNRGIHGKTRQRRDPPNTTGTAYFWTHGKTGNYLHTSGIYLYTDIDTKRTDTLDNPKYGITFECNDKGEWLCWSIQNLK